MVPSLRALLGNIVDYAGLFPPAKLKVQDAVTEYATQRQAEQAWMLCRFVCPADKLAQICDHEGVVGADEHLPWHFAVVGRGGPGLEPFLASLQVELEAIASFAEWRPELAVADALEVPLPAEVVQAGEEAVTELTERSAEALVSRMRGIHPFYEIGFGAGGPDAVAEVLSALQKFNNRWAGQRYPALGAKLRTGGPEAHHVPSTRQVAFFVNACGKLGLPFKCTAGLHQPIRHHDERMNTMVHGFLNVFGAAVLAHAEKADLPTTIRVLESERPSDFAFGYDSLKWEDCEVSVDQITEARRTLALSFGSCSFSEPVEGLTALKLL